MLKAGGLGEIAVMKRFIQDGYEVYSSVNDNSTYDLLVVKDAKLHKVEVKSTASKINGRYIVQLKSLQNKRHICNLYLTWIGSITFP